ncbi:MAG: nucleotidyltransferase domain-containing protein [Betaproteobacteria bacterium]|nr:nucleotidyltransferase domain-containing protein [Betaproteobacteria bacterium]
MPSPRRPILLRFDPAVLARVERYQSHKRLPSRAAAIDELIERGLARPDVLAGAISALRELREELLEAGVTHAAVFGSTARADAGDTSDIDVAVEFDRARVPDLLDFMKLCDRIADHVGRRTEQRVDVANLGSMRERVRERALRDAVYAF